ncbi:MAG: Ribosomal RNA small subunit methyltransferase B [Clostridiales bacterium 38_11]|nr:MAG: Ribosomal RNA small subunit methyltransferase B [Clostridiales bacterium 38_11]HBH12144.1 16S rRNA (cytosine(967)-C(5))-methyltransferase RsmB [Clostridiales bacterium]
MEYRKEVVDSLYRVTEKKKYSNIEIKESIARFDNKQKKDLYVYNFYGVIENIIFVDWVIAAYSSIRISKINDKVLNILRLAVFQLFFNDNLSESKIVFESVELTKKYLFKSHRFVNGILRNIIRNKENIALEVNNLEKTNYLSIKYSYPTELITKLIKEFGYEKTEQFCKASNTKPDMIVRVNKTKISRDSFYEIYSKQGFKLDKTRLSEYGIIIRNPHNIEKTEMYIKGLITPQDESSMLVGQLLNPEKKSHIIDMCCAPGGKCLHAAEICDNTSFIVGCDIFEHKLKLVDNNVKRLGLSNISLKIQDATVLNNDFIGKFDYCIVDVPCSNSGIIRRKPEIKYRMDLTRFDELLTLQKNILENASKYMKKGGKMIYSTCSVFDEENINLVSDFLKRHEEFELEDFVINGNKYDGFIKLLPHIDNTDGFFIACLKRTHL